jgi:hypothetical protein
MHLLSNRIGNFMIGRTELEEIVSGCLDPSERLPAACDCMRDFIILRCEFDYARDAFRYTAISHWFDIPEAGCQIPEYKIIFNTEPYGVKHVRLLS